jgi:hypothetical protein
MCVCVCVCLCVCLCSLSKPPENEIDADQGRRTGADRACISGTLGDSAVELKAEVRELRKS